MSPETQLSLWQEGKPIHDTERNACCPDFSCCIPELLAPQEVRDKFVNGDDGERGRLLHAFLILMLMHNERKLGGARVWVL